MSKLRARLPSSHSLFVFEAAARNLNFKLAASELNVTQPSISHSIKALEQHCKVELFVRDNRGVSLTEAGRILYDGVRPAFIRLEQSLDAISPASTQYITVAASTSIAAHWLVPKLPLFQQLHPGIKIKIVTTDRDVDTDHEVDMTIWLRPRDFKRPNSWYICDEVTFPVCSPHYLNASPPIREPGDLMRHRLVHCFDQHRKRMGWKDWLGAVGSEQSDIVPDLVFSDYQLAVQAALAGEGIALGWSFTAQTLLKNRLLVRPLAKEVRTDNAFFVVANAQGRRVEEMSELVRWILSEGKETR